MAAGRRSRLQLTSLWPALGAIVAASVLLWILLPDLLERSAAEQLLDTLQILSPLVAVQAADQGADNLQDWITDLAQGGALRVTLVASDGRVLADSERTAAQVPQMSDHGSRPEIVAALSRGGGSALRQSATTGVTYVYAARTVTAPDGRLYVLRLAKPVDELVTLRRNLAEIMGLAALVALIGVALVAYWQQVRLFRPLRRLVDQAVSVADGEYGGRLEPPVEPHLAALTSAFNRMASRVEEKIQAARAERDHLGAIVRSMADGVLVTDPEGRALLTNPAFRELFDLDEDPLGKRPLEITRQPELARVVELTLERGEGQSGEVELRGLERRTVALTSAALSGPRRSSGAGELRSGSGPGTGPGDRRGAVVVARDTTTFTRVNEMRRDFVANVSHELKTPLAAIRGYAETLSDGALEDLSTAQRFTGRILDQCRRLQALLADLLTLSRLESLDEQLETAPVELLRLARRSAELVQDAAAARRVTVEIPEAPETGGDEPLWLVDGNAESLERLFLNLLENAVKYNREGGSVRVDLSRAGGGVVIRVADTGIGIPAESLDRIFERFYRVDKGRSRAEGGTGLGLAIVKHIVQSHDGRMDVESEMGRGTTFEVWLPARQQRPAQADSGAA